MRGLRLQGRYLELSAVIWLRWQGATYRERSPYALVERPAGRDQLQIRLKRAS
jgi:hypothetical protein